MDRNIVIGEMKQVFKDVPYGIEHTTRVLDNTDEIVNGINVDDKTREIISLAAILHDIGALEAQQKYGSMDGHFQEIEGPAIARAILERAGVDHEIIDRVCYIVGNHHTFTKIDGVDFQILWEADLLDSLEFGETGHDRENLSTRIEENFKTAAGKSLALKRLGLS